MKRKLLSLLLCFLVIFTCFSANMTVKTSAKDYTYKIPGEIIVTAKTMPTVPDSGNFELYGVTFSYIDVYSNSETSATFLLILPAGRDSQEETEAAIEILNAHPDVVVAEQNLYFTAVEGDMDPVYKLGDVNGDGIHDSKDYTLVKRAVSGTYTLVEEASTVADVNENGEVDTFDYILVKRSTMDTCNIQLPMTAPTETQISKMIDAYIYTISRKYGDITFTQDDVYLDDAKIYGPYGNGNTYVTVFGNRQFSHMDAITEYEIGGRTLTFTNSNVALCWNYGKVYDFETAYWLGLLSDVDLEDLETRYNIEY